MKSMNPILGAALLAALGWPVIASAEPVTLTDVAGREVTVDAPVDRLILGEGRLIYAVAAIEKGDPFRRVVGWRDDLLKADPATFDVYRAKYPDIDKILKGAIYSFFTSAILRFGFRFFDPGGKQMLHMGHTLATGKFQG